MSADLLPCPWCGGCAEIDETFGSVPGWAVSCATDDCLGYKTFGSYARKADAAKAWNTRAPSPALSLAQEACAQIAEAATRPDSFGEFDKGYALAGSDIAEAIRTRIPSAHRERMEAERPTRDQS